MGRRHAAYFVRVARNAAGRVQGPDERAAVECALPGGEHARGVRRLYADRDADRALALVAALPEVLQIRLGFESAGWAERALELASAAHPLFAAGVGAAARGAWNLGEFDHARSLAARAENRRPPPGAARTGHPADVVADIALYEGDVDAALRHYTREVTAAPGRRSDPAGVDAVLWPVPLPPGARHGWACRRPRRPW